MPSTDRPRRATTRRPNPPSGPRAVLTFEADWRELQQGDVTAGGSLVVHYDPARLADDEPRPTKDQPAGELVAHARFLPGGQARHASLVWRVAGSRGKAARVPLTAAVAAELPVPPESREVELWFQRVDATGTSRWDSRYGANYRFEVVRPTPAPGELVAARDGAAVDPLSGGSR